MKPDPPAQSTATTTVTSTETSERRMRIQAVLPDIYQAMLEFHNATAHAGLEQRLLTLIRIHASRLNGCEYCIDMHSGEAIGNGESEERVAAIPDWRESSLFDARERAALGLTEAITLLQDGHVPDAVYAEAAARFTGPELAQLIWAATVINAWNRIGVATRMKPPARRAADTGPG